MCERRLLSRPRARRALYAAVWLLLCAPAAAHGQSKSAQPQAASCRSASQCLSLAMFYFNNDDISDRAARQFKTVIAGYRQTTEAETAQYYLASYYQRKFYIQRARFRRDEPGLLQQAQREYFAYIDRYSTSGSGEWLADAHFNLALAYAQLRDQGGAVNILNRMVNAARRDGRAYVYQVVWSAESAAVVDSRLDARALAEYTRSLVGTGRTCEQIVPVLTKWCQSQKSLRNNAG